jgi:hypothetical protein
MGLKPSWIRYTAIYASCKWLLVKSNKFYNATVENNLVSGGNHVELEVSASFWVYHVAHR